MTVFLRQPRFDADTPKPASYVWPSIWRFANITMWVTVGLALIMLTDDGINLFYILAVSLIGIPLALLMIVAVPLSAFWVPARLIYAVLRHRFSRRMALAIAVPFAALFANAVDVALKSGPDGTIAARQIVADQTGLSPVKIPADGIIAFQYDGPRWQWTDCPDLCQALLTDGGATLITNLDRHGAPYEGFYLVGPSGACAGNDRFISRSDTICQVRNPNVQAMLTVTFAHEEAGPEHADVEAIYHLTVQSGAMIQQTEMVAAEVAVGGGLLAPYGNSSNDFDYFSETETVHIVPEGMADLYATGVFDRSMWAGYTALMLSVLR